MAHLQNKNKFDKSGGSGDSWGSVGGEAGKAEARSRIILFKVRVESSFFSIWGTTERFFKSDVLSE